LNCVVYEVVVIKFVITRIVEVNAMVVGCYVVVRKSIIGGFVENGDALPVVCYGVVADCYVLGSIQ